MATYESCEQISVQVAVTSSVAAALPNRFVTWQPTTPAEREVIQHVPGANGAPAVGILAMKVDARGVVNGYGQSSMVVPDGKVAKVELGEAVTTVGTQLRVGGNSTEVDGAAYLWDAAGDIAVGYALETGAVGEIIAFQFVGFAGVHA